MFIFSLPIARITINQLNSRSDEELLYLFRLNDRAAFALLYDRYWKPLLAKAFDRLKNQEDAEEVVQELFVNLWRRREKIHVQYSFKTYIFAALRYEILHYIANEMKRKEGFAFDVEDALISIPDNDHFYTLEVKELEKQLEGLINNLPEKCRIIFKMSRNDEMSAREIADQLQLSHRTVETQISKALRFLKKALKSINLLMF